jgi:hypothetical protein
MKEGKLTKKNTFKVENKLKIAAVTTKVIIQGNESIIIKIFNIINIIIIEN